MVGVCRGHSHMMARTWRGPACVGAQQPVDACTPRSSSAAMHVSDYRRQGASQSTATQLASMAGQLVDAAGASREPGAVPFDQRPKAK